MNIKSLQALRKRQKKVADEYQKEIDRLHYIIQRDREGAKRQEERHQKDCHDIMDIIRQKYRLKYTQPFSFSDSAKITCDTVEQCNHFSFPNVRHWDYDVDMNLMKSIDSKIIMEEFLNMICQDIRHQWIKT